MKLYELTSQYEEIMNLLCDEEVDEQTVKDTLESLDGEFEDKADNYAKMIRTLYASAEASKAEADRLNKRSQSFVNKADWLKNQLKANMEFIEKIKFKTDLFSFSIAKNGGPQPLSITENLQEIPGKYLIPQDPAVNKEAVRELLKEKEVEWAHLEPRGTHLNIR